MGWYYASGDRREGPVGDEQLQELARTGTLTGDTLVWCEGMTSWQPWAEIAARTSTGLHICRGCNRSVPADELVEILGTPVCGDCKPRQLQCLREGILPIANDDSQGFSMGDRLVCSLNKPIPGRCVLCNGPASVAYKRTFHWHPRWFYLLFLLGGPFLLFIVLFFYQRKAVLVVPLCPTHDASRRRRIRWGEAAIAAAIVLGGLIIVIPSSGNTPSPWPWLRILGLLGCLAGLIAAVDWITRAANILAVRRVGKRTAEFARACPEYLASLPRWPGGPD